MEGFSEIEPGTSVRSTDAIVGTVEGLAPAAQEGETPAGVLLVRSTDGTRTYRVPATLVRRLDEKDGRHIVILNVSASALEGYVAEVHPAAIEKAIASPAAEEWTPESAQDTLRIPLLAEVLDVQTQSIDLGHVRVHKGVETTEQQLHIPVTHEEVVVERLAPEDYDATVPAGPDELIIPVVEERIVFEKRAVVKEYIRIRKQRVQVDQEIRGTVRREYVEVTEQPRDGQDPHAPSLFTVQ